MPKHLKWPNPFGYRGEAVCKFSATLTVGNQIFSEVRFWSILLIFAHFASFFESFRTKTEREAYEIVSNCLRLRLGNPWGLRDRSTCAETGQTDRSPLK